MKFIPFLNTDTIPNCSFVTCDIPETTQENWKWMKSLHLLWRESGELAKGKTVGTSHSSGPFYDKSARGAWTYAKEPGQWIPWTPSSPVRGTSTPAGRSLWHISTKILKNCEILPITLSLTKPFILSRYLIKTGHISQRRQRAGSQIDFGSSFSIPHVFCVPYFSS